ncbi:MAG: nuclear transport factor 2 family protein [Planctomycetota bacterium]
MKTALAFLLTCAALQSCSGTQTTSSAVMYDIEPGDRAAVAAALEDYVDGFTLGQPELLVRCLSPNLVKKGYRRTAPDQPYGAAVPLSYADALELARSRGASGEEVDLSKSSVEVFEVADKTAAGKVTAFWGIDYVHLVKENGRWMIHHIVWQTEPELAAN